MKGWTCCTVLLMTLAAALPRSGAAQPPVTVLVDGSGSMTGFFTTGALPRLVRQLRAVGADRVYAFTYTASPDGTVSGGLTTSMPAPGMAGNVTLLGRGLSSYLEHARDGEIAVMITDNVQDAGAAADEARDVHAFYEALTTNPRFSHVQVVPLRLAFKGMLYGPHGPIGPYDDLRGVAAYLITVGEADAERNRGRVVEVARAMGGSPIRMKPYRSAPVAASIDTAATRGLSATQAGLCPGVPLQPAPDSPNVLTAIRPVRQAEAFGGTFIVRLDSRLEGVALSRPTVSAAVTEAFAFTDFVADGDAQVTPTPPRLQTDLEPGDSAAVRISVCFPSGVKFAPNQKFATSARSGGRYEGTVTVGLTVPRADLRLAEQVKAAFSVTEPAFFSSTDPSLHRRIYGLEHAFRSLAPESVQIEQTVEGRLRFEVRVPLGPLLWLIARILGTLLLLGLLAWWITRSHAYRLVDEGGGRFRLLPAHPRRPSPARRTSPDPVAEPLFAPSYVPDPQHEGQPVRLSLFRGHPLRLQGAEAARLRHVPVSGARIDARPGYVVDAGAHHRTLGAGGGAFTVSRAADAPPPAAPDRPTRTRRAARSAAVDPDPFT